MTLKLSIKTFDELTSVDVYHILRARSAVFVVEQNCAYQDMDEVDFDCLHLVAHEDEKLIGYCRIIPPEFNTLRSHLTHDHKSTASRDAMPAIGRVLVLADYRGAGLARDIMIEAIRYCRKKYGKKRPIIISAQAYLIKFYESLGFVPEGDVYLHDNIEHITMVLSVPKKAKAPAQTSSTSMKILGALLFILAALFILGLLYLMI